MTLSDNSINELQCLVANIEHSCRYLTTTKPDLTIYTNASLTWWGVIDKVNHSEGFWHNEEITYITVLELKAISYSNKIFCNNQVFEDVKVMCGNTTAISYINHLEV